MLHIIFKLGVQSDDVLSTVEFMKDGKIILKDEMIES
jgi:hypothetical protein